MSSKPKPREAELNFEGAMDRLEKIVEQMESGKLPLEDLIVLLRRGNESGKGFARNDLPRPNKRSKSSLATAPERR